MATCAVVVLLGIVSVVHLAVTACKFPSALRGNFTSNKPSFSNVFFNDTHVEGLTPYKAACSSCPNHLPSTVFECAASQGNKYVLRSQEYGSISTSGLDTRLYLCLYVTPLSSDKVVFYQGPKDYQHFWGDYVIPYRTTPTLADVCDLDTPLPADRFNLLLKTDTLTSQSSACPDDLLGTFRGDVNGTSCGMELDVCTTETRQTIVFNDTSCSANSFFAANLNMDCLHSLSENDVTYLVTYTPQSPNVTFACTMYVKQGDVLYVRQYEDACENYPVSQNDPTPVQPAPTNTTYDFSLSPTVLCPFPCTLPSSLAGSWVSSRKGAVTFTDKEMSGFSTCASATDCPSTPETLECYRTEGTKYLLRSAVTTLATSAGNETVRLYLCLEFTRLSSTKYLYYQLHQDLHSIRKDYVLTYQAGHPVSPAQACGDLSASPYPATRHSLFLKAGSELESLDSCPAILKAQFNNTDNACESTLTTCDDPNVIKVEGTDCTPKPFFSGSGTLGCVYNVTESGTTYLTVVNSGETADGASTFDFTCVAMGLNGETLKFSQNPLECLDSQTATYVNSTYGSTFTYEKTDECPTEEPFDYTLIIIIVCCILALLLLIFLIILIICCIRRKRKAKKRKEEEDKKRILDEEDGRTSNLSLDSGYPASSARRAGTAMSHFMDVDEEEEDEDLKQHPVRTEERGHHTDRRGRPGKEEDPAISPDGQGYVTDADASDYSDDWEEYTDDQGQVHRRRKRRRRRKKKKRTYTRTRVLEDGTVIEEEVESEYSVTASSDVTSSGDEVDITNQVREARLRRKNRAQMLVTPVLHDTAIITREMDEKNQQPEKTKRRSFWDRLKRRAKDRRSKTKVRKRGKGEGGQAMDKDGRGRREHGETPYMQQYETKKQIERTLNDEGFFDDPADKITAETMFGFHEAERVLSPKQLDGEEERMATASDTSQSNYGSGSREGSAASSGDTANGKHDKDGKRVKRGSDGKHVIIVPSGSSEHSADSKGEAKRKDSDTSSGVADLTHEHQHGPWSHGDDNRRVSVAWERANNLYARIQEIKDKDEDEDRAVSRETGRRSRKERDKARVKTALRRLLNERLFGINNEKVKSHREHGSDVVLTPLGAGTIPGTRTGTRQKIRPITQGRVAFAEDDPQDRGSRRLNGPNPTNSRVRTTAFGSETTSEDSSLTQENGSSSQSRLPTGSGSQLPPVRNYRKPMSQVYAPAHFPKWGFCITASQRAALTEGLQRDRTFLSRQGARTAWTSGSRDDGLCTYRNGRNGEQGETSDDETINDPHRPDTNGLSGTEDDSQGTWADRAPGTRGREGDGHVAYTDASGKLKPVDYDDWRLRRLLQELYRDKKFMDKLINKIDSEHLDFPDTMAAEDVKFLSEFGREYLLQRAVYWEEHGPLGPPRPPPTALGMRLQRAQTTMTSHDVHSESSDKTSPRPKTVR